MTSVLEERARTFLDRLSSGATDHLTDEFSLGLQSALSTEVLSNAWCTLIEEVGGLVDVSALPTRTEANHHIVAMRCQFRMATLESRLTFDTDGRIAGVFFVPSES